MRQAALVDTRVLATFAEQIAHELSGAVTLRVVRRAAEVASELRRLAEHASTEVRERIEPVTSRAAGQYTDVGDREEVRAAAERLAGWLRELGGRDYRISRLIMRADPSDPWIAVGNAGAHLEWATPGQRALVVMQALVAETQNGGYEQFLDNCGELLPQAVDGARRLGWPELADALARHDASSVESLVDSDRLEQLMRRYVEKHADEFFIETT